MRVAVFCGNGEVIVLPIKGKQQDVSAIDGFYDHFSASDRILDDYKVFAADIGNGTGLVVSIDPKVRFGDEIDIDDWFKAAVTYAADAVGQDN